jgi:hypothetical protein
MSYRQQYQLSLDLVGGDIDWMESHGRVHPDELVDGGEDDDLPPIAA